ncbi:MAG: beta-galactosidase [bacterium]|nr:beta-galactosidase [bacterium]
MTFRNAFFCSCFTLLLIAPSFGAEIPRPEHPMPQMQRDQWLNLNGEWQYAETNDVDDGSFLTMETLPETITVPFCRESKLSGIQRTGFMKNVWYKRTFSVPAGWKADRIRLHIGACDWLTGVWVNGVYIGDHEGGYSAFSFDVTRALKPGENTVLIHAYDDSAGGLQPLGKQSREEKSGGIFYTRTTGIWQTVWLEGVGESFLSDFHVTPDPAASRILIQAEVDGPSEGLTVSVQAFADGKLAGEAETPAAWRDNQLVVNLSPKRLWSVNDPFLYDLKVRLKKGGEIVDEVNSYFGLRDVRIEGGAILINGEPVFQRLVLDQGFYPDGIWTAPTDDDLRGDIERSKAVGFNGARLHQKVFEPRFLYWADKLGYLVWGEYPSYGADYHNPFVNRPLIDEWIQIVRRDRNHPSIIGWCTFNETPSSAGKLQNTVARLNRSLDPTRPVIDTSGWTHSLPDPEVLDAHDYNQNPEAFKQSWITYFDSGSMPARYGDGNKRGIPFMISEFGGIGWYKNASGDSWGYGNQPKTLDEFYARFKGLCEALLTNRHLFGYCYTQLTDIEQEKNGIYYYDRTPKFDAEKLRAIQSQTAAYEQNPPLKAEQVTAELHVLLGGAPDGSPVWKYVTEKPGDEWADPDYDDSSWPSGPAGFGKKDGWESRTGTEWAAPDIWLRRYFPYDGEEFDRAGLVIHYDNATEVYVNGELIWERKRWNDRYQLFDVTGALKKALKKGDNVIAVHCHQDDGGQFIDAAILIR